VEASVGFLCPDDAGTNTTKARITSMAPAPMQRALRTGAPVVTYSLIIACVAIWALQYLLGDSFTYKFLYTPYATILEPWRMITSAFLHSPSSVLHILFNMYSLWIFGRVLEPILGSGRFLLLYLVSAFGGSVSVLWLAGPGTSVVGASGAIFGLMAAYFVVLRSVGSSTGQMVGLIAINLASGFLIPGVSWQGHLGGLIVGGIIATIYSRTRGANDGRKRRAHVLLTIGALILATIAGCARLLGYF
jgi:membrane associated rhomboid family serine protease